MNLKFFKIKSLFFYRAMPIFMLVGLLIQHIEYSNRHKVSRPKVSLIELTKCPKTGFNFQIYELNDSFIGEIYTIFYLTYNYFFSGCQMLFIEVALVNIVTVARYLWYLMGIIYSLNIVYLLGG